MTGVYLSLMALFSLGMSYYYLYKNDFIRSLIIGVISICFTGILTMHWYSGWTLYDSGAVRYWAEQYPVFTIFVATLVLGAVLCIGLSIMKKVPWANCFSKNAKKAGLKIVGVFMFVMYIIAIYPLIDMQFGISATKYETLAREKQNIPDDWYVEKAIDPHCIAMLFYNEERTEGEIAIFENEHDNFFFGYFAYYHGSMPDTFIQAQQCSNGDIVLLSLDEAGISELEYRIGDHNVHLSFSSIRPFVCTIPNGYNNIRLYDSDSNSINLAESWVR